MAFECCYAVESACMEILGRIAQGAETPEEAHVLRYFQMTTMRIKQLNSVLMSFLEGNDIDVGKAYHEVYGCFATLEGQQP
jgi:adenylate cyclase